MTLAIRDEIRVKMSQFQWFKNSKVYRYFGHNGKVKQLVKL